VGDHSVGKIVFKPEGYASHFEGNIQNPLGFGVGVSGVWVERDQAKPSKDDPMLLRKRICVGSIRDSGTAKNCGFLKKAPHRTLRQVRRWSVGHDAP
jgi:hypothetical protein